LKVSRDKRNQLLLKPWKADKKATIQPIEEGLE
jgi:hypothetical protein